MLTLDGLTRRFGTSVAVCNLHSLDLARTYCDRLIGMAGGRVVLDDHPATLTEAVARELYGLAANEVMEHHPAPRPAPEGPYVALST